MARERGEDPETAVAEANEPAQAPVAEPAEARVDAVAVPERAAGRAGRGPHGARRAP
ncbi:hypothetical protein SGLAM104S_01056 [Streptomyces glaucescens]